jgi:hypothetical protein
MTPSQRRTLTERARRARNYARYVLADRIEELERCYRNGDDELAGHARDRLRVELESEWPMLVKLTSPELDVDELDPA